MQNVCFSPINYVNNQVEQIELTSYKGLILSFIPVVNCLFFEAKRRQLTKEFEESSQVITREKIAATGAESYYFLGDLKEEHLKKPNPEVKAYIRSFKKLCDLQSLSQLSFLISKIALLAIQSFYMLARPIWPDYAIYSFLAIVVIEGVQSLFIRTKVDNIKFEQNKKFFYLNP